PDSTYDYSAVTLSASFPSGGYWHLSCNAQVGYSDTGGTTYQGADVAKGKGTAVEVVSLTVASGATQTNVTGANNWAAVKASGKKALIKATLKPDTDVAAKAVKWTGGAAVTDQPRQRTVDLGTSAKTNVKAAADTSSKDL